MERSRKKSTATRTKFRAGKLRAQVWLLDRLDRIPIEIGFPGDILDRQKDTRVATRTMADAPRASIVPARVEVNTASDNAFLSVEQAR